MCLADGSRERDAQSAKLPYRRPERRGLGGAFLGLQRGAGGAKGRIWMARGACVWSMWCVCCSTVWCVFWVGEAEGVLERWYARLAQLKVVYITRIRRSDYSIYLAMTKLNKY